jgi:hypothetical protein
MSENKVFDERRKGLEAKLEADKSRIVNRYERQMEGLKSSLEAELDALERRHSTQIAQMEKSFAMMPERPQITH